MIFIFFKFSHHSEIPLTLKHEFFQSLNLNNINADSIANKTELNNCFSKLAKCCYQFEAKLRKRIGNLEKMNFKDPGSKQYRLRVFIDRLETLQGKNLCNFHQIFNKFSIRTVDWNFDNHQQILKNFYSYFFNLSLESNPSRTLSDKEKEQIAFVFFILERGTNFYENILLIFEESKINDSNKIKDIFNDLLPVKNQNNLPSNEIDSEIDVHDQFKHIIKFAFWATAFLQRLNQFVYQISLPEFQSKLISYQKKLENTIEVQNEKSKFKLNQYENNNLQKQPKKNTYSKFSTHSNENREYSEEKDLITNNENSSNKNDISTDSIPNSSGLILQNMYSFIFCLTSFFVICI